jgi:hypothetical protein
VSRSKLTVAGVLVAILIGVARPAWAQQPLAPPASSDQSPVEPKWNFTFGYQYLYDGSWKEHLLYGFLVSVNRRLTDTFTIVAEGGGSHGEYLNSGFTIQRYAFLGGLKLHAGEGDVRPFFQGLAGYSRQGGDVGTANGIVVQPGGGVDLVMSESITLRAQGDYRWLREDGTNYNQYRIAVGIIWYGFKKR